MGFSSATLSAMQVLLLLLVVATSSHYQVLVWCRLMTPSSIAYGWLCIVVHISFTGKTPERLWKVIEDSRTGKCQGCTPICNFCRICTWYLSFFCVQYLVQVPGTTYNRTK